MAEAATPTPLAVDAKKLAKLLNGVCQRTIRTWDAAGIIPEPIRIGGKVMWSTREIEDWIAAGSPDRATWNASKRGNGRQRGR